MESEADIRWKMDQIRERIETLKDERQYLRDMINGPFPPRGFERESMIYAIQDATSRIDSVDHNFGRDAQGNG